MRQIGELFLLRTNLNSVGSVLDSPVRMSFVPLIRVVDRFTFLGPHFQEVFWVRVACILLEEGGSGH